MSGPGGFVFSIGDDPGNELVQRDFFHVRMELTALQTGESEDTSDHLVEFADLHFHTIVRAGLDGFLVAAGKRQCHAHAGKGRTQLMRDVAEEPSLAVHEIADASGHAVEVAYEVGNFVSAAAEFGASSGIQIAFRQMRA